MSQVMLLVIVNHYINRIGCGGRDIEQVLLNCAWAAGFDGTGCLAAPWKRAVAEELVIALEAHRTTKMWDQKLVASICDAAGGRT